MHDSGWVVDLPHKLFDNPMLSESLSCCRYLQMYNPGLLMFTCHGNLSVLILSI